MTCNVILLPEYLSIFLFESIVMAILILFSNLNTFFRTTIALILFFYLLYMLLYTYYIHIYCFQLVSLCINMDIEQLTAVEYAVFCFINF